MTNGRHPGLRIAGRLERSDVARYGGKIEDIALARRLFGSSETPIDYRIAIIPPH